MHKNVFRYFRYRRLEPIEKLELASDNDDQTIEATSLHDAKPMWTRKQATVVFLGNLGLFLMSICLLCVAISTRSSPSQLECAKKVSSYCEPMPNAPMPQCPSHHSPCRNSRLTLCCARSHPAPIWGAVTFLDRNIVNDFNTSSTYRGRPTLQRERAWHDLWHCE